MADKVYSRKGMLRISSHARDQMLDRLGYLWPEAKRLLAREWEVCSLIEARPHFTRIYRGMVLDLVVRESAAGGHALITVYASEPPSCTPLAHATARVEQAASPTMPFGGDL